MRRGRRAPAKRKCLHLYDYFMDRDLGLNRYARQVVPQIPRASHRTRAGFVVRQGEQCQSTAAAPSEPARRMLKTLAARGPGGAVLLADSIRLVERA